MAHTGQLRLPAGLAYVEIDIPADFKSEHVDLLGLRLNWDNIIDNSCTQAIGDE